MMSHRGDYDMLHGVCLVEQFLDFALGIAQYYYVLETGTVIAQGPTAEFDQAIAQECLAV